MGLAGTKKSVELLETYLNDHLAGAMAGSSLAESAAARNEGTSMGAFLGDLHGRIDDDRKQLELLMERLGVEPSLSKQATTWLGEKLSRLKLSDHMAGSKELRLLLELEALALGVRGKLLLWQALREVSGPDHLVADIDLDRLLERAGAQLEDLEHHRLEAARAAFSN